MTSPSEQTGRMAGGQKPAWSAVYAMTLGVFGLVTAEFLPASLLTPIAADLSISEGAAGQAVTTTALLGFVTSLLITAAARGADRRKLLMFFSVLLVASNLLVAFAPGLPALLLGRVLLGMALGGFWTMATAVTMRLVPEALIPRALSILMSGVSAATVLAAPIGSYLGELAGWRTVFLMAAALGVITFFVQWRTLPSMRPTSATKLGTMAEVLMRPGIGLGMLAVLLVFGGHFVFFTYLRAYLETGSGFEIGSISTILLGFGVANFVGTLLAGRMVEKSLRLTLVAAPLVMGTLALTLASSGANPLSDIVAVVLWGLFFGGVPVAWSSWIARTVPDQAESAGGLFVAAINLAIALGAGLGGAIFDISGGFGTMTTAGLVLIAAAFSILVGVRLRPSVPAAA
ncbi:MFS transporter [Rhizobium halophytocola]|uniref:MFS family arabinose efflux permease n=1 Tax=Rhizobium halophytocola TaxID=735519 RepID=A0ABS4E5E3_9HYPH|nr:MFS transporter [Rhizobium halophytocola]MBP1853170.1 putative MFS family arabinose efflux permease [Rhizobium halophytocola]